MGLKIIRSSSLSYHLTIILVGISCHRRSVPFLLQLHLSSWTSRLTVGAVTTGGLGSIEIRVDAGVELVQEVGSMGTSSLVRLVVTNVAGVVVASQARALSGAVGVTLSTVAVRVDARVSLVTEARVVGTRGVRVALVAGETRAGGVVAGQTRAGVGASATVLASAIATSTRGVARGTIAVGIDARISLVGEMGVVGACRVRAEVGTSVAASVRCTATQARAGMSAMSAGGGTVLISANTRAGVSAMGTGGGTVLTSAIATSAGGVAS